jgi:demethylmenaquinone methyltransferase/2-methoxy-6-polyprenyl-1,4-benzoquinol methylase
LKSLYDIYSFRILPLLGQIVAGDRDAYTYLVESIRRFPPPDVLVRIIEAAGLGQARFRSLTGGIAALHSAWRI